MTSQTKLKAIRDKYKNLTKNGTLGGQHPLREIAGDFFEICQNSAGEAKILSFTLYELLSDRANSENGGPITTQESTKFYKKVNKQVLEAFDALEKGKVKTETITAVIDAFLKE